MASLMHYEPTLAPRAQLAARMFHEPALAPRAIPSSRELHEVWEANFDKEFASLLGAVFRAGGPEATLALDMEFPGFPCADPQNSGHAEHHQALCRNIDQLWPIQLGVAVVGSDGVHRGVWTFNLHFDAGVDAHTEESLAFLRRAGVDFPRHKTEGIDALELGRRLASSSLVGGRAPCWLTFCGSYDWGYLLKLLTLGRPLPGDPSTFENVLSVYCPRRRELRDFLPKGSLEMLGRRHGVKRWGVAHTAGSDALLTLELFMLLGGAKTEHVAALGSEAFFGKQGIWPEMGWGEDLEEWNTGDYNQWNPGDVFGHGDMGIHIAAEQWENSNWIPQSQTHNDWFSSSMAPSSSLWYQSAGYPQPYFASL